MTYDTSFDTGYSTLQMNEGRRSGKAGAASGGGRNWLMAIAEAMGATQGRIAYAMMQSLDKMDALSQGDMTKPGAAQQFQVAATEFQAITQMFSLTSNANSTSLKSIGEGLTALARKS